MLTTTEHNFVRSAVRRILGSDPAVEDVVQNALLNAHRKRDAFQGRAQRSTWLYRIATNAALMHVRREKSRAPRGADAVLWDAVDVRVLSPEEEFVRAERAHLTRHAVARLPRKMRQVVELHLEGLSLADIARQLGAERATVRCQMHRARNQLRTALSGCAA